MFTATSLRRLYFAVHSYAGPALFREVLAPWLDEHSVALRERLALLRVYGEWRRVEYVWGDLLEQAYALHLPDHVAGVTEDEYVRVFSALGMRRARVARFDPFFHEIVAVEQSDEPDAPIEIIDEWWPCMMLGQLLFGRAGVRVRAGAHHAVAGIADRSMPGEVFIRRHRPTTDGSLGWGSSSQWKTDFRRDYLTPDSNHFNVDEQTGIDEDSEFGDGRLTLLERRDLLRHRCKVRPLVHVPESGDSWAGCWRLSLPRS